MAKDDFEDIEDFEDFDFSDLDEDDGSDVSNTTQGPNDKGRKPVEKTIREVYKAAKDNIKSKSAREHATKILEKSLSSDANGALNDLKWEISKIKDDAAQQLKPLGNTLSNISKSLASSLPKGKISNLLETLSKKLKSDNDSYYGEYKETLYDFKNGIESSLSELDNKLAGLSSEAALGNQKIGNELLKQQYMNLVIMKEQDRLFYNKSLELQWRTATGIEDMLKFQREQFQSFTTQFESIIKNTSLPEAVKLRNAEVAGMVLKQKAFNSLSESIFKKVNPLEAFSTAINRRIKNTILNARDAADNIDSMTGMAGDFEGPGMSKAGLAGTFGSEIILSALYGKLGKAIPSKYKNRLDGNIIALASNPLDYLKSLRKSEAQGLSGKILNKLVGVIEEGMPTKSAFNNTKLGKADLDSQALFDGRTHSTINTVIPMLLSKIHNEVHGLRTGKDVSEDTELRFDVKTQSFKSTSEVTKDLRSHIAKDMVAVAKSRASGMRNEVKERLKKVHSPNKDKILARLDKAIIGYITEYGTLSPEAMTKVEFLRYFPTDMQLEAGDLFGQFLHSLRTEGNSRGIYDLFSRSDDFLRMSTATMQNYATGMNADIAIKQGLLTSNGLTGSMSTNAEDIKNIFNKASKSKRYNGRYELYEDYDVYDMDWRNSLRHDIDSIRNFRIEDNPTGEVTGRYGTRMTIEEVDSFEQAEQSYRLRREQFIRAFREDPVNIALQATDPAAYERKLNKALKDFDKKPIISTLLKKIKEKIDEAGGDIRNSEAFMGVNDNIKRAGEAVNKAANDMKDSAVNFYNNNKDDVINNATNFYNSSKDTATNFYNSTKDTVTGAYDQLKENVSDLKDDVVTYVNSKGIKTDVTMDDAKAFYHQNMSKIIGGVNKLYEDAKNVDAEAINKKKQELIDQAKKVLPAEQFEAAKAYIENTDPRELMQDVIEQTKSAASGGKELAELAIRAANGDQEAIEELKEKASGVGSTAKEKIEQLQDELLEANQKLKEATTKKAKDLKDKVDNSEYIKNIKKKKVGDRTIEEREALINDRVDKMFNAMGNFAGFLKNPAGLLKDLAIRGAKGAIKAPFTFFTSDFAKNARATEREMYKRFFTKGIPAIGRGVRDGGIGAILALASTIGLAQKGADGVWNHPLAKVFRRKEREAYGVDDPDDPKNKNTWRNRLKNFGTKSKDSLKAALTGKDKDDNKLSFFSRLKELLKPLLFTVPFLLGSVKDAVISVGKGIFKVGKGIYKIGQYVWTGIKNIYEFGKKMFGKLDGVFKSLGELTGKGLVAAGSAAATGVTKVTEAAMKTKAGQAVAGTVAEGAAALSKTSIAKKITGVLKSFTEPIMKRLGPIAGKKLVAELTVKIASRAVPFLGWGLLLYDAAMAIKYMTVDGLSFGSAVSKAVLGFDLFNNDDVAVDKDGNPIKPDEPEKAYEDAKKKLEMEENNKQGKAYYVGDKQVTKEEYDKVQKENEEAKKNGEKLQPTSFVSISNDEFGGGIATEDSKRYTKFLQAFNKLDGLQRQLKIEVVVGNDTRYCGQLVDKIYYNIGEYANNIYWNILEEGNMLYRRKDPEKEEGEATYTLLDKEQYIKALHTLNAPFAKNIKKAIAGDENPTYEKFLILYHKFIEDKIRRIQEAVIEKADKDSNKGGIMGILKSLIASLFSNSVSEGKSGPQYAKNQHSFRNDLNKDVNATIRETTVDTSKVMSSSNNTGYSGVQAATNVSIYDEAKTSKSNKEKGMTKENLMAIAVKAMNKLGWSPREQAMFLANVQHETGNYRWFAEMGNDKYLSRYEGRVKDLGNDQPGDGIKYKGRGLIHLTGKKNYAEIGARLGIDIVKNPQLLEDDPQLAVASAIEWWNRQKERYKSFREAIANDDIRTVNKQVNGGGNGMAERIAYYDQFKKAWNIDGGMTAGQSTDTANGAMFQQALKGDFASTKGIEGINVNTGTVGTNTDSAYVGMNTNSGYTNKYNDAAVSGIDLSNLPEKSKALVETINKKATCKPDGTGSQGLCATYVRESLESAGFKTSDGSTISSKYRDKGLAGSAYMYDSNGIMSDLGFAKIDPNTKPLPGDVEVFNKTKSNPHGHIQVYNGEYWVSDFHQSGGSKHRKYGTPSRKYDGSVPSLYRYAGDNANSDVKQEEPEVPTKADGSTTETTTTETASNTYNSMPTTGSTSTIGSVPTATGINTSEGTTTTSMDIQRASGTNMAIDSLSGVIESGNDIQSKQLDINEQVLQTLKEMKGLLGTGDDLAATRVQNQRQNIPNINKGNLKDIDYAGYTMNNTNPVRPFRPDAAVGQYRVK